jgi:predicted alpha/beta hydrolase family esterase
LSPPILIVPGWTNAGPRHWMTLWKQAHPEYQCVEQRDWEFPDRLEWATTLDAAIRAAPAPPILVAHSLGCITIAHWAAEQKGRTVDRIAGAMLVAPADVDAETAPEVVRGFRPIPLVPFGFPNVVVASRTDYYLTFERATELAKAWDGTLVDAGDAGHLNTDAGYGPWPAGEHILLDLQARLIDSA